MREKPTARIAICSFLRYGRAVQTTDYFKGWAIPGPRVPGENDAALGLIESHETLDAISGRYRLFQLRAGHRFSTDDVLTAWYGTCWAPTPRTVLDLGSGIGSVGMIAAWRLPVARFVTIEAQEVSVALAQRSARYNGLTERYDIRHGDFRELHSDERFDLVLGSPPYFPLGSGIVSEHPQKVACRFETRGSIADYCQTAAAHLSPAGYFACVFPCIRPSNWRASSRPQTPPSSPSFGVVRSVCARATRRFCVYLSWGAGKTFLSLCAIKLGSSPFLPSAGSMAPSTRSMRRLKCRSGFRRSATGASHPLTLRCPNASK